MGLKWTNLRLVFGSCVKITGRTFLKKKKITVLVVQFSFSLVCNCVHKVWTIVLVAHNNSESVCVEMIYNGVSWFHWFYKIQSKLNWHIQYGVNVEQLTTHICASGTEQPSTLFVFVQHHRCMLRVLDSFGTEPEFNHAHYAQSKGHKTPWGKWNLNPQQFNTMFRKSAGRQQTTHFKHH